MPSLSYEQLSRDEKKRIDMLYDKEEATYSYDHGEFVAYLVDERRGSTSYKIRLD
jgi:hypothetical protein